MQFARVLPPRFSDVRTIHISALFPTVVKLNCSVSDKLSRFGEYRRRKGGVLRQADVLARHPMKVGGSATGKVGESQSFVKARCLNTEERRAKSCPVLIIREAVPRLLLERSSSKAPMGGKPRQPPSAARR